MSMFVSKQVIYLPRVSDLWELQNIMAVVSVGWKSSQGCVVMKKIIPSKAHCRMTTGMAISFDGICTLYVIKFAFVVHNVTIIMTTELTCLSKISGFFYRYLKKKTCTLMKNNNNQILFECNFRLLKSDKNCLIAILINCIRFWCLYFFVGGSSFRYSLRKTMEIKLRKSRCVSVCRKVSQNVV